MVDFSSLVLLFKPFLNTDFIFFKLIGPVLDLGFITDIAYWSTSNHCVFFLILPNLLSLEFFNLATSDEVDDLPLPDPLLLGLLFANAAADIFHFFQIPPFFLRVDGRSLYDFLITRCILYNFISNWFCCKMF